MISQSIQKKYWILIANSLDHAEILSYTLLVPWIMPKFFPYVSPLIQLIWGYGIVATGLLTKPLGSLLCPWVAHSVGPLRVFRWCLVGSALFTGVFLVCPGYTLLKELSPILLIVSRFFRGLFSAGQSAISKIYVMEEEKKEYRFSYLYQFSTMMGYVGASIWVYFLTSWAYSAYAWGFIIFIIVQGSIGLILSSAHYKENAFHVENISQPLSWKSRLQYLSCYQRQVYMVALTTGLTHLTWNLCFVFINGIVPLVMSISSTRMMATNPWLMGIDTVLILFLGPILGLYTPERVLIAGSFVLSISLPSAFALLDWYPNWWTVMAVRFWIVMWGVIISCPLHVHYKHQCPKNGVYLIVGLGNALGSSIIGKLTPVLTLWIYSTWKAFYVIGLYSGVFALITCIFLVIPVKKADFKPT